MNAAVVDPVCNNARIIGALVLLTTCMCCCAVYPQLISFLPSHAKQSKSKQRCVMGVGMCLYAQLVQT